MLSEAERFMLLEWKQSLSDILRGRDPLNNPDLALNYKQTFQQKIGKRKYTGPTRLEIAVMKYLDKQPTATMNWIAVRVGTTADSVRKILDRLTRHKYIEKVDSRHRRLTPLGKEAVK